ncbi:hypothetical protein [Methylobrevis albus]
MTIFSPREIVSEPGRSIVGQKDARCAAVAIAKDWRTDRYLCRLEAMKIAAEICVYTNENVVLESLDAA